MRFSVIKNKELVSSCHQIVMVDGTVPGWTPREGDYHFDHHRKGGADVQIDEIPSRLPDLDLSNTCFVTTQLDADACIAAAFIILTNHPELIDRSKVDDWLDKLRAIAYDCDHLCVPPDKLHTFGDFAAKCVAAMKQNSTSVELELNLPDNRKDWTEEDKIKYSSLAFERGTLSLVDACLGRANFPGENGEANKYFAKLERQVKEYAMRDSLIDSSNLHTKYVLFDARDINEYVDPRVWIRISQKYDTNDISPITLTWRKGRNGTSYTLGVIPGHLKLDKVNNSNLYSWLTQAERAIDPTWDSEGNGWGGRKTVGGSSWNTGSLLTPFDVIKTVDNYYYGLIW
jgi:hypothetical protein